MTKVVKKACGVITGCDDLFFMVYYDSLREAINESNEFENKNEDGSVAVYEFTGKLAGNYKLSEPIPVKVKPKKVKGK